VTAEAEAQPSVADEPAAVQTPAAPVEPDPDETPPPTAGAPKAAPGVTDTQDPETATAETDPQTESQEQNA
jgi:hypothetical protein